MYIKSNYLKPLYQNPAPKAPRKKSPKIKLAILFFIFLAGGFFIWNQKAKKVPSEIIVTEEKCTEEEITEENNEIIVSHTICEGDIPAKVFSKYGNLDANDTANLLLASEDVYDFTNLKIGQKIDFVFSDEDKSTKIKYYQNTENIIVAELKENDFQVTEEKIPYLAEEKTLLIKIDEFLYKDALEAGLSEASILEIADIFSFDIDFTTEIRQGDELKIIYEKRTLNGQLAPDGKVLAAKFTNAGQEYFAYYFELEGEGSHYDSEGHELVRQFLRAPLSYRQITSGYTGARLHPITKTITAHYQIDYAAPIGTPVVATAKGTVTRAGWSGGWGNIIYLRHENGYATHYGHLSAYGKNIKSGVPVSQGQVIGYVGSTGWSTGPHLDYGMKLNGSPINPLSLKLPKGIPLNETELEKFQKLKKSYEEALK